MAAAAAAAPARGAGEEDGEEEEIFDLSRPEVVSKYRDASNIVNTSLQAVLKRSVPGADIMELCILGDKLIDTQVRSSLCPSRLWLELACACYVLAGHASSPGGGEPRAARSWLGADW